MKRLSISSIISSAKDSFLRFPLTIILAFIFTVCFMVLSSWNYFYNIFDIENLLVRIIMVSALWIFLSIIAVIVKEILWINKLKTVLMKLWLILLLVLYFFYLPEKPDSEYIEMMKYFLFVLCSIIWVFLIPLIWNSKNEYFWNYVTIVFFNLILTYIFSIVFCIWFIVLLIALDYLFWVKIEWFYYAWVASFFYVIFSVWHFCSRFPKDILGISYNKFWYSKIIKIFSQYVLIGLVSIYMLVLYAYGIKILITTSLPKWWLVWLIMFFALLGYFSVILLYPLFKDKKHVWVSNYMKIFFIVLLPILILYFIAIWIRVADYWITINRYFVLLFWLRMLITSCYYLFSVKKNLVFMFILWWCLIVISSVGPRWAIGLSEYSQKFILKLNLQKFKLFEHGKIVKNTQQLFLDDYNKIEWPIKYLVTNYWSKSIAEFMGNDLKTKLQETNISYWRYSDVSLILDYMWVSMTWNHNIDSYFYYNLWKDSKSLDIWWYDYVLWIWSLGNPNEFEILGSKIYFVREDNLISIYKDETIIGKVDLTEMINWLTKKYSSSTNSFVDVEDMVIKQEIDGMKVMIVIDNVGWDTSKSVIRNIDYMVFLDL